MLIDDPIVLAACPSSIILTGVSCVGCVDDDQGCAFASVDVSFRVGQTKSFSR